MTAGQRNCYLAIEECLNRYSFDDLLFALGEHVARQGEECQRDSTEDRICKDIRHQVEQMRGWMRTVLSPKR